ncbi:MAG: YvaD family protein [bacterium]|nr:YvaD family protein [bacterium]
MKRMKPLLLITDIGFITYWCVSLLLLAGVDAVPVKWLFKDYEDPIVYAWNWSFFPLDMVLSICF